MVKCLTCNGLYLPMLPDGMKYFHACPPLSDAEVKAALTLDPDDAKLSPAQLSTVRAAPRARVNARDENVPTTNAGDAGKMKAAGGGTAIV